MPANCVRSEVRPLVSSRPWGEVEFNPNPLKGVVNGWHGRFTAARNVAPAVHEQMAIECARYVQNVLKRRIAETGRSQEHPGGLLSRANRDRLVELIVDPQNRPSDEFGFTVGVASFLDSTDAAPYWRELETGTPRFVGRIIYGWWITPHGSWTGPQDVEQGTDPRLIQVGGATHDVNALMANKAGDKLRKRRRNDRPHKREPAMIVINRPIPAYEYFQIGGHEFFSSGQVDRIYESKGVMQRNRTA